MFWFSQVAVSLPVSGNSDTNGNGSEYQVQEMRFRGGDQENGAVSDTKKRADDSA